MVTVSLVVVYGLLGVYAWLCTVAAGVSLLRLLPSSSYTRHSLRLFHPRWQAIQLLLGIAIAGFWYFYNRGLTHHAIDRFIPTLVFTGAVILFQLILQLTASLGHTPAGFRPINVLYALCCGIVLLGLGSSGIIGLTGATFWHSNAGWLLFLLVGLATLGLVFNYIYYAVGQTPHDRLHQIARWLNIGMCFIGIAALLALSHQRNHRLAVALPIGLFGLLMLLQVIAWLTARERYMWWALAMWVIIFPVILALANLPFVFYSTVLARTSITMLSLSVKLVMIGVLGLVVGSVMWLLWPLSRTATKH